MEALLGAIVWPLFTLRGKKSERRLPDVTPRKPSWELLKETFSGIFNFVVVVVYLILHGENVQIRNLRIFVVILIHKARACWLFYRAYQW